MKKFVRYSGDRKYIEMAKVLALCGTCKRRNYGAIIIHDEDDTVVSIGYTGAPVGEPNCCDLPTPCFRQLNGIPSGQRYEMCKSVHAEMNAIARGDFAKMKDSTLYLAGYDVEKGEFIKDARPCDMCRRNIQNARIKRVVNELGEVDLYQNKK